MPLLDFKIFHNVVQALSENFMSKEKKKNPAKLFLTLSRPYRPHLVFQLWGCQTPQTEPWHIFGTKNNLKSHLDNSRFLSLAAKGWQISMDIIVEKFKISKILSFKGAMHLK